MLIAAGAGAFAWATAIVTGPWLAGPIAGLVYAFGSIVCHQLPDRSFHVAAVQLPVCARCAGLYVGAAAGLLAWSVLAWLRPAPWSRGRVLGALAMASVPTAVTVASAMLGLGDPPNAWRAALAVPLGLAGGAVVGAVASDQLK